MIRTGVFLVLLGTTLGASTKTEVRYEGPNQITVSESIDDCITLPGLGPPPFAPSFFHQGSNFFFNPQIVMPVGDIETGIERMMIPFKPVKEVTILNTDSKEKIIEKVEYVVPELPSIVIPKIEIEEPILTIPEIIENVEFVVPELPSFIIPKIEIEEPILTVPKIIENVEFVVPELPSFVIPKIEIEEPTLTVPKIIENVEFVIPELPSFVIPKIEIEEPTLTVPKIIENVEFVIPELPSFVFPKIEIEEPIQTIPQVIEIDRIPMELPLPVLPIEIVREEPCVDVQIENVVPNVPILVEEPVRLNKIPSAPELPPLILSEIQASIMQENKKVILVPSAPELTMVYPPSIMIESPFFPTECAQNIVFERILPNMAFEYGKTLELISIPATKRTPVVSSIMF